MSLPLRCSDVHVMTWSLLVGPFFRGSGGQRGPRAHLLLAAAVGVALRQSPPLTPAASASGRARRAGF